MSKKNNDGLELFEHIGGKTSVRQKRKMRSKNNNLQKKLSKKNVKSRFNRNQLVNNKKKMNSKKKRNMRNKQKGKLSTKIIKSHGSIVKTEYGIQKHMKGGSPVDGMGLLKDYMHRRLNGKNPKELYEQQGWDIRKLKIEGFTVLHLIVYGIPVNKLVNDFNLQELKNGGCSFKDLYDCHRYTKSQLRQVGFTASDFFRKATSGIPAGNLNEGLKVKDLYGSKGAGFTARQLYDGGYAPPFYLSKKDGVPLSELAEFLSFQMLEIMGYTIDEMKDAGLFAGKEQKESEMREALKQREEETKKYEARMMEQAKKDPNWVSQTTPPSARGTSPGYQIAANNLMHEKGANQN